MTKRGFKRFFWRARDELLNGALCFSLSGPAGSSEHGLKPRIKPSNMFWDAFRLENEHHEVGIPGLSVETAVHGSED